MLWLVLSLYNSNFFWTTLPSILLNEFVNVEINSQPFHYACNTIRISKYSSLTQAVQIK